MKFKLSWLLFPNQFLMLPFWGAVVGGAISAAGSLMGGKDRNKAAKKAADKQMAFQREMSNTAHRREVKDLRAAGLNPILSSKYGGASTPGGATYQPTDVVTPAVNSALSTATAYQQMKNLKETQELIHQQAGKAEAEKDVLNAYRDPRTKGADIIDKGIEGISSSAKSLGEAAAKGKLWLDKTFADDWDTRVRKAKANRHGNSRKPTHIEIKYPRRKKYDH